MSLVLDGTNGLSDVDGSAATPAIRGTDANTGIFFPAADTIAFAEGGAEVARFDANGNLGVGTTSPSSGARLTVTAGGSSIVRLFNNSQTTGQFEIGQGFSTGSDNIGYIFNFSNAAMVFGTNATERARINSSGQFDLFVTNADGLQSRSSAGAGTAVATFVGRHSASSTQNGTISFVVWNNGNIVNTNNSYGSLSDLKLKENIVDATPKLEKLCQVRVVNYNLKGDYEQHKQIGVIAQELEQIFPGMVDETSDRDAEGNDLGTTTKSVKYSVFVPMLIKAIQEQQAIITALTAQVAALDARLISLEGTQP
jgi:hypothetical protein